MPRDVRMYLWDIEEAGDHILTFTRNKTLSDYAADSMLRAAVERKFEIVGEALVRLAHHFPVEVQEIGDFRSFIGFRNVLIHQYEDLKHANVWQQVHTSLPLLLEHVSALRKRLDLEDPIA